MSEREKKLLNVNIWWKCVNIYLLDSETRLVPLKLIDTKLFFFLFFFCYRFRRFTQKKCKFDYVAHIVKSLNMLAPNLFASDVAIMFNMWPSPARLFFINLKTKSWSGREKKKLKVNWNVLRTSWFCFICKFALAEGHVMRKTVNFAQFQSFFTMKKEKFKIMSWIFDKNSL